MISYIPEENIFLIRESNGYVFHPGEKSLYINLIIPLINDVYCYRLHDDSVFVEHILKQVNEIENNVSDFYEKIIMSIFYNSFDPILTLNQVLKMVNHEIGGTIDYFLDRYIREVIELIRKGISQTIPNYSCYVGGEDYRIISGNDMLISHGDYYYLKGLKIIYGEAGLDVLIEIKHKGENNDESES